MDRIILLLLLSVDAEEGKCNNRASTDMQYVCKEVSASNDQFVGSILLVCYGVGCRCALTNGSSKVLHPEAPSP